MSRFLHHLTNSANIFSFSNMLLLTGTGSELRVGSRDGGRVAHSLHRASTRSHGAEIVHH